MTSLKVKGFPITQPVTIAEFLVEMGLAGNINRARQLVRQGNVALIFECTTPHMSVVMADPDFILKPSYVNEDNDQ